MLQRILVVDDDELLRESVCLTMHAGGYTPISCGSGEAALDAARNTRPHLVLLDIVMPDLDGFGVLEALKAQHYTRAIPVLVMTTLRTEAQVQRARELGAAGYVCKPVDKKTLLLRVQLLLPARDGADDAWTASKRCVEWLD